MRWQHQTFGCLLHDPMTLLLLGLIYGAGGISHLTPGLGSRLSSLSLLAMLISAWFQEPGWSDMDF